MDLMATTVTGFWYHSHYTGFSHKIKKYCICLQGTFLRNIKKRSLEREPYPDSAGIIERLHFSFLSGKHFREEILRCAVIVNSVSASCVKTHPAAPIFIRQLTGKGIGQSRNGSGQFT